MAIVCLALSLALLAIVVRSLLSFVPGAATSTLGTALERITEPVLGPIRNLLPPVRLGGMGLDLSPLIVFLIIEVLSATLPR